MKSILFVLLSFASLPTFAAGRYVAQVPGQEAYDAILQSRKMIRMEGRTDTGQSCFLRVHNAGRGVYSVVVGLSNEKGRAILHSLRRPKHFVATMNVFSEVSFETEGPYSNLILKQRADARGTTEGTVRVHFIGDRPNHAEGTNERESISCSFSIALT